MNLHNPERQNGESQADYRARRKFSHSRARYFMTGGMFAGHNPSGPGARSKRKAMQVCGTGQHPKFAAMRKHKPKDPIKPTWPRTDNQNRQQRAMIVLGKNRERDAGKRTKPKSAVAKRMDRPSRTALMDAGHIKLMRFFGTI